MVLAGACLVLASCSKSKKHEKEVGNNFREGEIVVRAENIDAVLKDAPGLKATSIYKEINLYNVRGKALAGKEIEYAEKWQANGLAKSANPNFIYRVADLPDRTTDPYWLDLWGLSNVGQDAPNGTEGKENADIGVLKAWNAGAKGSDEVLVAVMDTGIDYLHPDLIQNIYTNAAEFSGQEHKDEDGNGYEDDVHGWNFVSTMETEKYGGQLGSPVPMDGHGHGTHVAGTIGAVANNGIGVAGINQHVKMIALKVLSDEGSGDEADIIRAVRYAAKAGVDVVNASFGGGGESQNFLAALEEAGKAGVLFVAAAGNDSNDSDQVKSYPANYDVDTVISVAATDNRDQLAVFSNYGYKEVDIAAPGVNIRSTYPRKIAEEEGTKDDPYRVFSGTSMATPHVVGAAALVLGMHKDLRKHPAELKKLLMESADWLPQLAGRVRSGGRLNVGRAVLRDVKPFLDDKNWKEREYAWASPSLPEGHVDVQHTIKQEGVKAIQAHISSNLMDAMDLSAVYDGALRLVSFIPADLVSMPARNKDYWTPVVYGDSVTLRFANALVTVTKVKEKLKGISEEEAMALTGDIMCFPSQTISGKYDCTVWDDPSKPYGNNRSEGFKVDKIRVLE
jgi:hypothetical protein